MGNVGDEECPTCSSVGEVGVSAAEVNPRLSHWPIQIKLMGTVIPFIENADLLVAADCTAFAVHDFHKRFLRDKKVMIGCPKLDDAQYYLQKFTEIFSNMNVNNVTCLRMEVPCCGGLTAVLKEAINRSGKKIPLKESVIGVKGDLLGERTILG